jgi:hypothetical protein
VEVKPVINPVEVLVNSEITKILNPHGRKDKDQRGDGGLAQQASILTAGLLSGPEQVVRVIQQPMDNLWVIELF